MNLCLFFEGAGRGVVGKISDNCDQLSGSRLCIDLSNNDDGKVQ